MFITPLDRFFNKFRRPSFFLYVGIVACSVGWTFWEVHQISKRLEKDKKNKEIKKATVVPTMDQIAKKYPLWKRVLHKFQARRGIPFRRRFFVGYDLHGNTYWEFTPDGNMLRLRRKLEPWRETLFEVDHFSTVPPQWLQWLRRTREMPPTLQELIDDKIRQQRIKLLAQQADQKWLMEKARLEQEQQLKFQAELGRVETEKDELERQNAQNMAQDEKAATGAEDPWAAAAESAGKDPIVSADIKPRK